MSVWTHVNSSFRIANSRNITDKEIYDNFGKVIEYEDIYSIEDINSITDKILPCGSEGSLDINILRDINYLTVSVFGDLRDYEDTNEIKDWFYSCCEAFEIKQAFCQVECEGRAVEYCEYENIVPSNKIRINISLRLNSFIGVCKEAIETAFKVDNPFPKDSINLKIWNNPDDCCLSAATVNIFGDISSDVDVKEWFTNFCDEFWIRQAYCQISQYGEESIIWTCD